MKNKVLSTIVFFGGLVALFSACSDDNFSAPSATIATPDISSSSNDEAVPSSSEVPASSADAIPLSSESLPQSSEFQESSSSSVFLPPLSSSWLDGGNGNMKKKILTARREFVCQRKACALRHQL